LLAAGAARLMTKPSKYPSSSERRFGMGMNPVFVIGVVGMVLGIVTYALMASIRQNINAYLFRRR
jgi:hypothetical protein